MAMKEGKDVNLIRLLAAKLVAKLRLPFLANITLSSVCWAKS